LKLISRTITLSCEYGIPSPTIRETPNLDFRQRTRQRASFRTTKSSLGWKLSTWNEVSHSHMTSGKKADI